MRRQFQYGGTFRLAPGPGCLVPRAVAAREETRGRILDQNVGPVGQEMTHDEEDGHAAGEQYFPDDMSPVKYYHPVPRGLEIRIREKLEEIEHRNQGKKNRQKT